MKKKTDFHIVKKKVKEKKKIIRRRVIIIIAAVLFLALLGGVYIHGMQTYTSAEVVDVYENVASDNGNYITFAGGVLRYSRDGVVLFDMMGEEMWNQSCQMQSPMVEICGSTAVLGDREGTSVMVLEADGVKGEFQTAKPIEQLAVSEQGIVVAVLKDETTPQLVCYDAKGNTLISQNTSLLNTGYPLDVAIAPNGETLIVSYMYVNSTSVTSEVVYYNFGSSNNESGQNEVARESLVGQMVPLVSFLDEDCSILVSDERMQIWEGTVAPKKAFEIELTGELEQIAFDEKYIATVVKEKQTSKQQLHIYNRKGQEKTVYTLEDEYNHICISGRQVILFRDNKCFVMDVSGVVKYDGQIDVPIEAMERVGGLMRYAIVGNEGIYKIELKK